MTVLVSRGATHADAGPSGETVRSTGPGFPLERPWEDGSRRPEWLQLRRIAVLGALSVIVLLVATASLFYGIGSLIHARDQRNLLAEERSKIDDAAVSNQGLYRPALPTRPPVPGSVVGILDIPAIGLQAAVVEGVTPSETVSGPGHVPGTAGLGQPGNSAVVGRRSGYGGTFGGLGKLHVGDSIVTATTEGQSVYVVRSVRTVSLTSPSATSVTSTTQSTPTTLGSKLAHKRASTLGRPPTHQASTLSTTKLYGPSTDTQLTLVTSASSVPWNSRRATVVVARMKGEPFAYVPQESASPSELGMSVDGGALPWFVLALLALLATVLASMAMYRRASVRSAYILTTAPLLVFGILTAEALSRLLPAWS